MSTPISPETAVYGFTTAGDPQISPDGARIAYVLGRTDRESGKPESQVWLCDRDGSARRQMTHAGTRNRMPRWSPDGRTLAFVADRDGQHGVYLLPMEGGEARELVKTHNAITEIVWSPDGARIAFTAVFDPDNPTGEPRPEDAPPPVRVTSRIDYKQDNRGYLGDVRTQVFVADMASGAVRQVTRTPVDHAFPRWSPDGEWLAVQVPNRNGMCSQLALVHAGTGETALVTPEDGVVTTWAWSPDGTRIVYTGDLTNTWQTDFFVLDVAARQSRRVTDDLQCLPAAGFPTIDAPSMPVWLEDGRVLFHAVQAGTSSLYVIDLESGAVEQVDGAQSVRTGMSVDAAVRYVVQSVSSLERTGDILVFDREAGRHEVITDYSGPVFAESPPAQWERFDVQRDGFTTEAWLLKPPDFDPAKRYPVVLDVHGGPNGYYGYAFNAMQQVLATNGFVVVYSNPRGSSSYGREFTLQVARDWGGEDFADLMAVLDRVLEEPWADSDRQGIWGYSYGGFMTATAIGRTRRFAAAVCGAPCFDLESMFGTSDISHTFGRLQWGGAPWEDREWYATHSPSQFAHHTRTPTLIIHGEADERCPIGQGEQMFVTLKEVGCEVEFARYPGGSHLFLRVGPAEHRRDVYERSLRWFREHLGGPV